MTASFADIPSAGERVKPTREQALAIAERRKAARRSRTRRIRRAIAILAVAAFLGPFGIIFTRVAAGHDPALSNNTAVASTSAPTSADSSSSGSSVSSTAQTTSTPAPVTTQQS